MAEYNPTPEERVTEIEAAYGNRLGSGLKAMIAKELDYYYRRGYKAGMEAAEKIAHDRAAEFEEIAHISATGMNKALNRLGAADCRLVAEYIREWQEAEAHS